MVEVVECIGQVVNIGANPVGRLLLRRALYHGAELHQGHFQHFFRKVACLQECLFLQLSSLLLIFVQNGLDSHNGVENIRSRISLKRGEPVNVEHIILGNLVGKIPVFQRGERHHFRHLRGLFLRHLASLPDFAVHLLFGLLHQALQPHHAAVPGLKRFAVTAVHGAVAQKLQFRLRLHQPGFAGTAEYLFKIQFLTFIRYINNLVRIVQPHPFHDSGKIRGIVEGRAIGF